MAAIMVHGYVQICKDKEKSYSKRALIETVEGQTEIKLLLYFSTGKVKTFQLNDNIKSVALRSYGENQNHLYLAFKNNDLLFIEMMSSTDAKNLKTFLDRVHQNQLKSSMIPDEEGGVFMGRKTQKEINKTSLHKICKKSTTECFKIAKKRVTFDFQKMPSEFLTLTNKKFLESQLTSRKRMLSLCSEMNGDKKSQKEDNLVSKFKTNTSRKLEKLSQLGDLKGQMELPFRSSLFTNFSEKPYVDSTCSQTLTEKIFFPLVLEPNYSVNSLEQGEVEMFFIFHVNKQWQGLPNLGNTCYMNAVLQCLRSVPSFINDILNQGFLLGKIPCNAFNMCLVHLLVLKYIYRTKMKMKLLMTLKNSISVVADIFSGDRQNDAHEFLSYCLDQLKGAMQKLNTNLKTKNELGEEILLQQDLADNVSTLFSCPVINNFEFELLHSIFCKACGQAVIKTELSNYVSLNLPQGKKAQLLSVQSTFDLFFETEELEYKCEKCKHKKSVAVHKFSRLPRVLIVHLKRYKYSKHWSLRKDMQKVSISKCLTLSSHCNGDTKPPLPLSKNSQLKDLQFFKFSQKIHSKILNASALETKMTPKFKDALALRIESNKESKPQQLHNFLREASRKHQQKDQRKDSKLTIIKSEALCSGNEKLIEKELLDNSVTYLINKNGGTSTSHPGTNWVDVQLQGVPENSELNNCEENSISENNTDFCEDRKTRISERLREVRKRTQQNDKMRIHVQGPQQALPLNLPKQNAQVHTEYLRKPIELSAQKAKVNSKRSLDPSRNPGKKDILEEKTESEAKEPKGNADKKDPHTYQLIGVISHLGDSLHSGHYISDAYDFKRRCWFSYNDLQVSVIQERVMQETRISTGYIFFYMHNETFKELMVEEESSQSCSTEPEKTPMEK